jgi:hypothetical protein
MDALENAGVTVNSFELEDARDRRRVILDVRLEHAQPHMVTGELLRLEQVLGARWAT